MRLLRVLKSRSGKNIDFKETEFKINSICKSYGIKLLYIFGSYAFNNASSLSDLDIAYLSGKRLELDNFLSLLGELQETFEEEAIDLVDLSNAPLTLTHRVLREGICIYAEDLRTKIEFETKYETLYFDTVPLRKEYFQNLIRRIEDGTFGYR